MFYNMSYVYGADIYFLWMKKEDGVFWKILKIN